MKDQRINKKAALSVSFHKGWLNKIKNTLGNKCTYISHVQKGDEYFMKVNITNASGGKDRITYKLKGAPNTLTSKDYQSLLKTLIKGEYETRSEKPLSVTKG